MDNKMTAQHHGVVFTRVPVVEFMLDLVGYHPDEQLHTLRLLEPSFGDGRFVIQAAGRLLQSWRAAGGQDPHDLIDAIRAVETDPQSVTQFSQRLVDYLVTQRIAPDMAQKLAEAWLMSGDYLTTKFDHPFDFVVGNPPYVRHEAIPKDLLKKYRARYRTMVGRADLYIPFMEKSLDLLSSTGKLSFITPNAWMKNDYGKALRAKIDHEFHLSHYVDMCGADAFETVVGAYPAITVIERGRRKAETTRIATGMGGQWRKRRLVRGGLPWLTGDSGPVKLIDELERRFPTLVTAGCRVGIGVATGADKIFIDDFATIDVEAGRCLPLVTNSCVRRGQLAWTGKGVLNPWADHGGLVDLADYPKLAARLHPHRDRLARRYTARSDPRKWYKTIDRITPELRHEPKLLIPDIKANGDAITYDAGNFYPHHNLYYITSQQWNLRALQALLRSGIAHLFVAVYSVKIGGGYLRFQAQNLKRIRIPHWHDISPDDQQHMIHLGEAGEKLPVSLLARIYGVKEEQLAILETI